MNQIIHPYHPQSNRQQEHIQARYHQTGVKKSENNVYDDMYFINLTSPVVLWLL